MPATLDLTRLLSDALPRLLPAAIRERDLQCLVLPTARLEVCGVNLTHSADVQMLLECRCIYAYCKTALYSIYGETRLTHALCGLHDDRRVRIMHVGRLR